MKRFFKNLLLTITVAASLTSCGWLTKLARNNDNSGVYGSSMRVSYTMMATNWQVDSICRADELPNLEEWIVNSFQDYETGQYVVKKMYIKEEGQNEIIYIIVGQEEPYQVTRRITE